jgi:hypothetical protein
MRCPSNVFDELGVEMLLQETGGYPAAAKFAGLLQVDEKCLGVLPGGERWARQAWQLGENAVADCIIFDRTRRLSVYAPI